MKKCQGCDSLRIINIGCKHSDAFWASDRFGHEHEGYAPRIVNVCGGDYTEFSLCLSCGQVQGDWPQPMPDLKGGA